MPAEDGESWQNALTLFDEIASQSLAFYPGLSSADVRLLNYSENATYLVENRESKEKFILRVNQPGYHTKPEIESELEWLLAIHTEAKVKVHLPIPNREGNYIQTIQLDGDPEEYYCTLFSFLPGQSPDEEQENELIRNFETLGEITAHLHEHSVLWNPSTFIERPKWDFESTIGETPKWGRWQDGLAITPDRMKLFQRVVDVIEHRLNDFGKDKNRFGLIHADLRLSNFIVENDEIHVIDFDDCGFGWYLYDLASSLSFIEHKPYVRELVDSWLKGYRKVRELSEQEEAEIPTFIMLRRLMLISWIGSRNNETTKKMGEAYTEQTDELCVAYLNRFGY